MGDDARIQELLSGINGRNATIDRLTAEVERLAHGICDALDTGKPTEPILRALLKGTSHEGHRHE